jgi:DNA-binding FadR family transcriptional regulator
VLHAPFQPVRTRRTFEEALEQIVEAIRIGDLPIGARLPSERTLAAQMKIARQTLREALKMLNDAGVITVEGPRGGAAVQTDMIPIDLLREQAEVRMGEVGGVLEARRLFEPRVAQLAALHADEDDFRALQATINFQSQAIDDHARYMQLDYRFHLILARATKNQMVLFVMREVLQQLRIARDMVLRAAAEQEDAIDMHVRTLEAVRRADPDEIEAVMDEHLRHLEEVWEREVGRPRFRPIPDFLLPKDAGSRWVSGR